MDYEWASKELVRPIRSIEFPSALDAMMVHGVQVYFISTEDYERIMQSQDHGHSFFTSKESENQRQGVNVRSLK